LKNKLLIFTHEYPPFSGGVATFTYEYASHLSKLGINVVVLAPLYSNSDKDFDKLQNFKTIRMNLGKQRGKYINHLVDICYFLYVLYANRINKVFLTDYFTQRSIALFNLFRITKFVVAVHGTEMLDNLDTPFKRLLFRKIYVKCDFIICISNYTKNLLINHNFKCLNRNIRVVYNGINFIKYSRPRNEIAISDIKNRYKLYGKKVLISLCRLTNRKGIDNVIRAMQVLKIERSDIVYLICGVGEAEKYLMSLAKELRVEDMVIFVGYIPEISKIDYLDVADIYVMLSKKIKNDVEGFGISFLEAAARKIPIVGYKFGGVEEAVIDGKTGILLDSLETNAISDAIDRILNDNCLRKCLVEQGFSRCKEELNWDKLISENIDIFV